MDAFWAADVVNDWNDQHSPRKTLTSPRKPKFNLGVKDRAQDSDFEILSSPRKGSPSKTDRSAAIARKAFESRKHQLAEDFLKELDRVITHGKIGELAAECGGVKLEWNKKLNSTAGRANWRRERIPSKDPAGASEAKYKHHASIELAEKVIDDEDRLFNTIAHEYCHLTNFMISNIRDNPHGAEFKSWAAKVTQVFNKSHNITVTTKHTYEIAYKYVWTCSTCGHEFKRHSKSIDTTRHACGSCKGALVQTKPAVRAKDPNKGPNEFQVFLKENFKRVKKENEGLGHGAVMQLLAQMYKDRKAKRDAGTTGGGAEDEVAGVAKALEVIVLDD
ncbi:hypothetical protein K490DRAFT_44563 [Saccharata proteae CBS 121410]|uniref:SprT-like domain-containing protein n=1 Tax=Saccharata proteae CBS 121410 TaxID=1314787 RepID=A0A9P4HT03_9PEZI|nr:hypothetical protein K490DRAFT_44563 [Saccharata proteae CBS 121410]